MCRNHRPPVSDAVSPERGEQINCQLHRKIHRNQRRNLSERNPVFPLERQKQQVAEDIKRLEALQALQKEQAELEAQRAQAEREALAAQKAQAEAEAQRVRAEREALAAQKAQAAQEAQRARAEQIMLAEQKARAEKEAQKALKAQQKAMAEQKAQADKEARQALNAEQGDEWDEGDTGSSSASEKITAAKPAAAGVSPLKKYLPFILGGVGVVAVVIVVLIVTGVFSSKDKEPDPSSYSDEYEYASLTDELASVDWYRETDQSSGISYVYPSSFDKYEDESGEYFYYFDPETYQSVTMRVYPIMVDDDNRYYLLDKDYILDSLGSIMENKGISVYYRGTYGDNIWYAGESLDDVYGGESISMVVFGMKDKEYTLQASITYNREETATQRYISEDDLLYLFYKMVENLSVG